MGREHVLGRLDKAWQVLQESHAGLGLRELLAPGVCGEWSVKDILAHVAVWEQEAVKHLPLILAGGRAPRYSVLYGGIDAFNAQVMEGKKGLSLDEVLQQGKDTHHKLRAAITGLPEGEAGVERRFRHRVRLDATGHYLLHAEGIRAWRARQPGEKEK